MCLPCFRFREMVSLIVVVRDIVGAREIVCVCVVVSGSVVLLAMQCKFMESLSMCVEIVCVCVRSCVVVSVCFFTVFQI